MLDLKGADLLPEERERLRHPLVGGVILFSRNYETPAQVTHLVNEIHALREPRLMVAVDHEGGAVQRFRSGFTQLPACALFGKIFDGDPHKAVRVARDCGWIMAAELRAIGVDFSFAPVLDLGVGISQVINDRAFHRDAETIARLAQAYASGMREAGMAAVGKHFPGHGSVEADSHHAIPVDPRPLEDLRLADLIPFERLTHWGLPAIMPAHVIYPKVDAHPAGFSSVWLRGILRKQLGFQGTIFSDDISMAGAAVGGDYTERARLALHAGCDMVLVCNNPEGAVQVLDGLGEYHEPIAQVRLMRMHGRSAPSRETLLADGRWQGVSIEVNRLVQETELALGDDGLV
jgi:beta-N-acetylhexosaminidase